MVVKYVERNLLLLVTSTSDLSLRRPTIKYCSVVFGVTLRLLVQHFVVVSCHQQTPPLTSDYSVVNLPRLVAAEYCICRSNRRISTNSTSIIKLDHNVHSLLPTRFDESAVRRLHVFTSIKHDVLIKNWQMFAQTKRRRRSFVNRHGVSDDSCRCILFSVRLT